MIKNQLRLRNMSLETLLTDRLNENDLCPYVYSLGF